MKSDYVRGWLASPSGGIKVRNGRSLRLARNYVDDTSIPLYSFRKRKACLRDGLKNVIIYGNHLIQRTRPGRRESSLSYYEPHSVGKDENIKYSANVFEIFGSETESMRSPKGAQYLVKVFSHIKAWLMSSKASPQTAPLLKMDARSKTWRPWVSTWTNWPKYETKAVAKVAQHSKSWMSYAGSAYQYCLPHVRWPTCVP